MNKIIKTEQAAQVAEDLRARGKQIVLAGGCFDILHIGHITFLQKAKEHGDVLLVFLESDEDITRTKGVGRPINIQIDRATILAHIELVDYIIMLRPQMSNAEYDTLVTAIRPKIIATTKGDMNRKHKERQATAINAQVVDVTLPIKNQSTTRLIEIFNEL